MTSVTIPDTVTVVEDEAFSDCKNLTNIIIPDSITTIKYGAFSYCSKLTDVVIPEEHQIFAPETYANAVGISDAAAYAAACEQISIWWSENIIPLL